MITKTTALLGMFLLTACCTFAQNFEGKIIYQNSIKSKAPTVTDEQMGKLLGTVQEFFIKDGDYKSVLNGTLMQWQLYINKDNKMYSKMSNSATVYWYDGATNPDEVLKAEVNKNVITILGYPCDELILTCKSGMQKYYFSTKLKLDAKLFAKHKFGNWSEYAARAHAIPLKMYIDNAQITLESVATEVKPMKLEDKEFQLPADSKLEKSPY